MLSNYQKVIENQYEAAFCTLSEAVRRCPDESWRAAVAKFSFSQSAFHGLFFADLYLGQDVDSHGQQPFHKQHAEIFDECGQWDKEVPSLNYDREFIVEYLQFCRQKMRQVVNSENESDLDATPGFPWLAATTRAEVHIYNIRHIQHHAAQLIIALRRDTEVDVPWMKTGWETF